MDSYQYSTKARGGSVGFGTTRSEVNMSFFSVLPSRRLVLLCRSPVARLLSILNTHSYPKEITFVELLRRRPRVCANCIYQQFGASLAFFLPSCHSHHDIGDISFCSARSVGGRYPLDEMYHVSEGRRGKAGSDLYSTLAGMPKLE